MKIYPIVEGHGEVQAVPLLLRRLQAEAAVFQLEIARSHRRHRSELTNPVTLRKAVQIVRKNSDCGAIIVIFDADDDCPKETFSELDKVVKGEAREIPSGVVMANREYEAWLLANVTAFTGICGIGARANFMGDPENPRDAKGMLESFMGAKCYYDERTDQPKLTAAMDLAAAYRKCRSFRKLVSVFGQINSFDANSWPPERWTV